MANTHGPIVTASAVGVQQGIHDIIPSRPPSAITVEGTRIASKILLTASKTQSTPPASSSAAPQTSAPKPATETKTEGGS
mmetsp:Transcript_7682/g.12200  ORF Transcript_7682/g.12200 Transcript_7682/m.12200 type:complete len:80 (-) Transcript_7682:293-532(-)